MNGVIRIEFQIIDGNLRIALTAPLQDQAQRDLTVKVLANAIPIAINFQPSLLIKPGENGAVPPIPPPLVN